MLYLRCVYFSKLQDSHKTSYYSYCVAAIIIIHKGYKIKIQNKNLIK